MKKHRGVSLIEILVVTFIASIIMGAAFHIFRSSQKTLTKASVRQLLANEVRVAIKNMAQDFKAVKSDSLEVNISPAGESAEISFDRYLLAGQGDQSSLVFDRFERVTYELNRPILTRKVADGAPHTLCRHVESLILSRPENAEDGGTSSYEEGWSARIDIRLIGRRVVPGTVEMASHTETVSVFMLEEYFKLVNKNRFVGLAHLAQNDDTRIQDDDFDMDVMFQAVLNIAALEALSDEQLASLLTRENIMLASATASLSDINDAISGVDARGRRFFGLLRGRSNEVSNIQDQIEDHDSVEALNGDIERLDAIIVRHERRNLADSFRGVDLDSLERNDPEEYKRYKEAYELMLRDRSMRLAAEGTEGAGHVSVLDNINPDNMTQGVINSSDGRVEFTEDRAAFEARQARARSIYEKASRINLDWAEDESRSREYSAAKDLRDLAEAKRSYAEQIDLHELNIGRINQVMQGRQ